MFKVNKLSASIKIALAATMVVSLSGCLVDGDANVSTSTSGGEVTQVSNPVGTVVGLVQDTNGNPLANVTVYLAGASTVTDTGGNYSFANVGVINTAGADANTGHQALSITIAAPVGHLGATVTVSPNAQIDGTFTNAAINSTSSIFIDGFLAQAGTAVLPALSSTVQGVLRDNDTGAPIAGATVALDMERTGITSQRQEQNNVGTTYQTLTYSAVTDSDGSFSIANVPADSELRFVIASHVVNAVAFNDTIDNNDVLTSDEIALVDIGNLYVTAIVATDNIPPHVVSVTGVINQKLTPGQFNDDINGTGGLVINFSESMSALIDTNTIIVRDTDNNAYIDLLSANLSADSMSLTLITSAAIPAGATLDINMRKADLQDLSGNVITISEAVGYDTSVQASTGTEYLRLRLQIFIDTNQNAIAVAQAQLTTDATGMVNDSFAIQDFSVAFNDVVDGVAGFQQLNNADDDDTLGGADSAERLTALATAINGNTPLNVVANFARVSFTATNASYYKFEVTDSMGTPKVFVPTLPTNVDNIGLNGPQTFTATNGETIEIVYSGVEPSDIISITPFDDFGYAGSTTSVTLVDNVEPTTVLQRSYNATPVHDGNVTSVGFGAGGELASQGVEAIGTPYLNVTPQLIDNLDSNGNNLATAGAGNQDDSLRHELFENNTVDAINCLTTQCIDPSNGVYDANAYTVMLARSNRIIGISMSEDLASVGTPVYSGTNARLTNYTVHNDVIARDDGTVNFVDLVNVEVDNIFAFAADNNASINFQGQITDTAGNIASTTNNAKVIIRDAMPPMVMSSTYNGVQIVINFNEAVAPTTEDLITIGTVSFFLSQETVDAHGAPGTDSSILTIPTTDSNWIDATGSTGLYGWLRVGTDSLADWNYDSGAGLSFHGRLDFRNIEDAAGNSWNTNNAGIAVPIFAYRSTVPTTFRADENSTDIDWTTAGTVAAGTPFTFTYSANHAINMHSFGATANATSLTGIQVASRFDFSGAGAVDAATATATLSTNRRVLTVTVVSTGDVAAGDTFGPIVNFGSDFDGTQLESGTDMQHPKP